MFRLRLFFSFLVLLLAWPAPGAGADDWPQFRRDAQRTGASTDRVALPLTEIWSRAGGGCALWKGRAYYIAHDELKRQLICVDARTGAPIWRRVLSTATPAPAISYAVTTGAHSVAGNVGATRISTWQVVVPPAVTENGIVYAYDQFEWRTRPFAVSGTSPEGQPRSAAGGGSFGRFPCVRAFHALDGREIGFQLVSASVLPSSPLQPWRTQPVLRLLLFSCQGLQDVQITSAGGYGMLGHPLLVGDEILALGHRDLFFRWSAVQPHPPLFVRLAHPIPGLTDPDLIPSARLGSAPLALAPNGLVVPEDGGNRFVLVMDALAHPAWHLDMPWTLGVPAVEGSTIFLGVGGFGAQGGLLAVDALTGAIKWTFKTADLKADLVRFPADIIERRLPAATVPGLRRELPSRLAPGVHGLAPQPGTAPARNPAPGFARPLPRGTERLVPGSEATRLGRSPPSGPSWRRPRSTERLARGSSAMANGAQPAHRSGEPPVDLIGVPGGASLTVRGMGPVSPLPPGHEANASLVLRDGRVFAQVSATLVALDQRTGRLIWQQPLNSGTYTITVAGNTPRLSVTQRSRAWGATSLVGSRDHLFVSGLYQLAALRLDNGKPERASPIPAGGQLAVANGILYLFSHAKRTHAMAPAERTYQLAIDSGDPHHYLPPERKPETDEADAASRPPAGPPESQPTAPLLEVERGAKAAAADASILRLLWSTPLPDLLELARERLRIAPGVPLLLSLDWLNAHRSALLGPGQPGAWQPREMAAFVDACARLAAEAKPAHFDVAPEVNVYLARYPEQAETVVQLVRQAREAIRRASPGTKVLVSLNCEVLARTYGKGRYLPFGRVALKGKPDLSPLAALLAQVDEIGLTAHPQSATSDVSALRGDYLLAAKALVAPKPVLVTRMSLQIPAPKGKPSATQTPFLRRLLQLCYWLDAGVVVYPDVITDAKEGEFAALARNPDQPALGAWNDVLNYRKVARLSAAGDTPVPAGPLGELGDPPAERSEITR